MTFCYRLSSKTNNIKYITRQKCQWLFFLFCDISKPSNKPQATSHISTSQFCGGFWGVFAFIASEFKQDNKPRELWLGRLDWARLCWVWRLLSFRGQLVTSQFSQETNPVDSEVRPIHTLHSWCHLYLGPAGCRVAPSCWAELLVCCACWELLAGEWSQMQTIHVNHCICFCLFLSLKLVLLAWLSSLCERIAQ